MVTVSYDIVYRDLKKKIISGKYPVKSLLPSEPQLCAMFNVSRTTIRKAVDILQKEGYVSPQRGIGTVVMSNRATQDLNKLSSMTQTLTDKGFKVTLKEIEISIEGASQEVAEHLNIEIGAKVAYIFRVMCASNVPIAIMRNYIPYEYVNGIENYSGQFTSLYKLLKEEYYLDIKMTRDKLTATNANAEEAELLSVAYGFALINVHRECVSKDRVICYDIVNARSDMYEYKTNLFNND